MDEVSNDPKARSEAADMAARIRNGLPATIARPDYDPKTIMREVYNARADDVTRTEYSFDRMWEKQLAEESKLTTSLATLTEAEFRKVADFYVRGIVAGSHAMFAQREMDKVGALSKAVFVELEERLQTGKNVVLGIVTGMVHEQPAPSSIGEALSKLFAAMPGR
jgi:hypothetical protein